MVIPVTPQRVFAITLLAAHTALADPGFLPLPVPPAPAAPAPPSEVRTDVERAVRGVRQQVEERRIETSGSRAELEAYRARELRDLERRQIGAPQDARSDVDRARERLEFERRVDRIEKTADPR
jgi:hypothetical protein